MNTLIIVPANNRPTLCPECGKEERKIEVCKWCKYEYADDEPPIIYIGIGICVFVLCILFGLHLTPKPDAADIGLILLVSVLGAVGWPLTLIFFFLYWLKIGF